MDASEVEELERLLEEDPAAAENGKAFRKLCDDSEDTDSEELEQFVAALRRQNGEEDDEHAEAKTDKQQEPSKSEDPSEAEEKKTGGAQDHRRLITRDRSADIEYYTTEQLGPRREHTPEGFLVCYDVPVARTGEMVYGPGETPIQVGRDGRAKIQRSAAEVFSKKSMASLQGKPVTDDHPPVDVAPDNWRFYTRGVVQNPRRGEGEHKDFVVVDLIIYDAETIADIDAGKREVSCGYNPDYLEVLDDAGNVVPGEGEQANILYNHLALVERGRCGPRCAIGDRKTVDHVIPTVKKELKSMSMKSALRKLQRAFSAKDATAFDDAMEELETKADSQDAEKEPDTIEVHNHIPGPGNNDGIGELPPKDPAKTDTRDDEQPEWFKNFSKDCMDRFKSMDDKFEAFGKKKDDDVVAAKNDDPADLDPNLEMDRKGGRDAKDDEANKSILGELEFEAPPGTAVDKAYKAKDSAYLEDSFQDAVSKAEILAPGIRVPTFDRAAAPVKTAKALFGLRKTALDLAYAKPETRGMIDSALGGRTFDSKAMPNGSARVLFNAVAAQAARDNNERSTDTRGVRPASGGGHAVGGKLTSLASINERNKEKYGRKSA